MRFYRLKIPNNTDFICDNNVKLSAQIIFLFVLFLNNFFILYFLKNNDEQFNQVTHRQEESDERRDQYFSEFKVDKNTSEGKLNDI